MTWQHFSPDVIVVGGGFKKCCISIGMEGTDDDVLWNGSVERMGMLVVSARKMKAPTVKITLIGKGR
jgi:hypothetical protein